MIHLNNTGERNEPLESDDGEDIRAAGQASVAEHRVATPVPDRTSIWDQVCECVVVGLRHCTCTCSYVHPDIVDGGEEPIDR